MKITITKFFLSLIFIPISLLCLKNIALSQNRSLFWFIIILLSWLLLATAIISLLKILFPNTDWDNYKYSATNTKSEKWKSIFVIVSFLLIWFGSCTFYIIKSYQIIEEEETKELKNFGNIKLARIYKFGYKGKGPEYAFYEYYFDKIRYTGTTKRKEEYNINDSLLIIYSKQRPYIFELYEKHLKNINGSH